MSTADRGDADDQPTVSLRTERNPLPGVPDLLLRVKTRSIGARILMGLLAIALLAL